MKIINAVAVTLLIAVVTVFPAALLGQYLPGIFDPALRPVALAAWLSGLVAWFTAAAMVRKENEAAHDAAQHQSSSSRGAVVTVAFLGIAVGIVAALHFFGDGLLDWARFG